MAEFEKTGRMRWFSHLDLQRAMQRALRRAQLPVAFSQGYNPHVLISFATALSVGCESVCEMMDVALAESCAPEEFVCKMNGALPEGLRVRKARLAQDGESAPMAVMRCASYTARIPGVDLRPACQALMQKEQVVVEKRSKTKVRQVDIRPMVLQLDAAWDGRESLLTMTLTHTNADCLKPELLLQTLQPGAYARICRTGLYAQREGQLAPLFEASGKAQVSHG